MIKARITLPSSPTYEKAKICIGYGRQNIVVYSNNKWVEDKGKRKGGTNYSIYKNEKI